MVYDVTRQSSTSHVLHEDLRGLVTGLKRSKALGVWIQLAQSQLIDGFENPDA